MGNIRNRMVKRISRDIVLNFYDILTTDFQEVKTIVDEKTNVQSKKLRNQIAGYTVRVLRKIEEGKIQTLEELE